MGWFSAFSKENNSATTNQTTTNYTDSSANAGGDNSLAIAQGGQYAGAGGISAGAGANVSITTSDPATVAAALHTVEANNLLSATQYQASLNTLAGVHSVAANSNKATQDAANLAIQSTQSLASQLSGKGALETPQTNASIVQTVSKYASIAAVAIAAVVALALFMRKGKK
ncbi:MAG: hypothetical protein QM715_18640 [Nibricoccus sp.]